MSEDAATQASVPIVPPSPIDAPPSAADALDTAPKRSLARRVFRPWVVVTIVAATIVAGNVWMYMLVDGWRVEDRQLRAAAHDAGQSVGEANAMIESQDAMLDLLADQSGAAQVWAANLEGEIAEKRAISDGYKSAGLAFERCGDKRAEAIATLWSGGAASALIDEANAECASAQAQLDALEGGG